MYQLWKFGTDIGEYEFSSDKLLKRAAEQDPNDVRLSNLFIEKKYPIYRGLLKKL